MPFHRGLVSSRTCSAVGTATRQGRTPWKQQRGYSSWVFSRLFRYLSLNYGRHRPPDSKRIRNVWTPTGLSSCKETTPGQWDGPSLLWVVLLCELIKTVAFGMEIGDDPSSSLGSMLKVTLPQAYNVSKKADFSACAQQCTENRMEHELSGSFPPDAQKLESNSDTTPRVWFCSNYSF